MRRSRTLFLHTSCWDLARPHTFCLHRDFYSALPYIYSSLQTQWSPTPLNSVANNWPMSFLSMLWHFCFSFQRHHFPQFNPQSIEPLTLICCQQSHGLVLKEPPVRPVPLQCCWERHSTTHCSMRSLLSPRCLLFPLFCHSKTEKQRKSSKRDRQTEREWREKRRRQTGRDVRISDFSLFFKGEV